MQYLILPFGMKMFTDPRKHSLEVPADTHESNPWMNVRYNIIAFG